MADPYYPIIVATDATALEGGQVFIGAEYQDPEQYPVPVFWDDALTIPAAQPLQTSGGVIVRDGTPANVYAATQTYSIRVRDRAGTVVWYKTQAGGTEANRLSFPIATGPAGADSTVPGPADNTYTSYSAMQASDPNRQSARLVGDTDVPPHPDGPYNNPTKTLGGWLPQTAQGIASRNRRAAAVPTNPEEVQNRRLDVMDFVDAGDRAIVLNGSNMDLAYAYNRMLQAAAAYDPDLTLSGTFATAHALKMPHAIRSPIYIRRGVSLLGAGHGSVIDNRGATGTVYNLGIAADGTPDPGGAPSELRDIRTFGGPANKPLVKVQQPGSLLSNLFHTSVSTGIEIYDASDVQMSNITMDQGTIGLKVGGSDGNGSRNLTCTNLITYTMDDALFFDGNVFDSVFSNVLICYPRLSGIYFMDAKSHMRNIRFNGGAFVVNTQSNPTQSTSYNMVACIRSRANDVQMRMSDFSFRNWKGHAVFRDNGIGFDASFHGCEFNGEASDLVNYNDPSTTAKVYTSGANDRVTFQNCIMANLPGQPIETTGAGNLYLTVAGCQIYGNDAASLIQHGNTNPNSLLVVKDNVGDGTQKLIMGSGTAPVYIKSDTNIAFIGDDTVASANIITVPKRLDVIRVTGTATVTGITPDPSNAGRRVTFVLDASQQWTDGGNINLQSNFAGTQDDCLTLATGDGLNWYEVARSPN